MLSTVSGCVRGIRAARPRPSARESLKTAASPRRSIVEDEDEEEDKTADKGEDEDEDAEADKVDDDAEDDDEDDDFVGTGTPAADGAEGWVEEEVAEKPEEEEEE